MTVSAYANEAQFRAFVRDPSGNDPSIIQLALNAAARGIDKHCRRHFYQTTGAKYFSPAPNSPWVLDIDDLATTTGLAVAVQVSNAAAYNETRTINTDFVPEPRNQSMAGIDGWPYTSLRSITREWPPRSTPDMLDTIRVTGTWGWPAFPDPVVQANLIVAAGLFKSGEAPWGVAGFDAFGAVRVRENPIVTAMLADYRGADTLLMA